MPAVQHDAIVKATQVVLDHYGLEAGNVISHAEWTRRKTDPFWNSDRRAIEAIRDQLEDDMPLTDADLDRIWGYPSRVPDGKGGFLNAQATISRTANGVNALLLRDADTAQDLVDLIVDEMGEEFAKEVADELAARLIS
jgi:hypothetical protein